MHARIRQTVRYVTASDGVRLAWAERHPEVHRALLRALLEASHWCDGAAHRPVLVRWLAARIGASEPVIAPSLLGRFARAPDEPAVVQLCSVCVGDDGAVARESMRRRLFQPLFQLPYYQRLLDETGLGDVADAIRERLAAGDLEGAVRAFGDDALDELVVAGDPEQCRARLREFAARGADAQVVVAYPVDEDWPAGARAAIEALSPAAGYAWSNLCYSFYLSREFDRAIEACGAAIMLDADAAAARNNLALALAGAGRLDQASDAFDRAGDPADGRYNMGLVYLALGQFARAADESLGEHSCAIGGAHRSSLGGGCGGLGGLGGHLGARPTHGCAVRSGSAGIAGCSTTPMVAPRPWMPSARPIASSTLDATSKPR